jgi:rare lipoprotein A
MLGIFLGMPLLSSAKEALSSNIGNAKPMVGVASFYAARFQGKRTASGEKFDNSALTAAHKSLPFGSQVKVTNLRNGKSVVVRINDRGPYVRGRIIDLSKAAAKKIGLGRAGTARVKLEVLRKSKRNSASSQANLNTFLGDVTKQ